MTRLPRSALGDVDLPRDGLVTFEFTPPGDDTRLIAAAQPVRLARGTEAFGWLVVAKPVTELRAQWLTLLGRLALALAVGIGLAGMLFWWLSRRLTEPVLTLTRATQDVAAGRYDVEIPDSRGSDEISLLSDRFRRMVAKLAEGEQLKRSFLMSVSHELRTPLTAIRGHVEALREGIVSEPEQVRSSLDVIASEADRLERLVGDVLDLAKLQAHRFTVRQEEVDLGRVLDHAYNAFAEEARRREIDYRLEGVPEPPVIFSDGDRVLQVISNLLSNAFRWTPDGGRIELELAADNGTVRVDVADSGPGITAGQREPHLRALHLERRERNRARTPDREGARDRARRQDRALLGTRQRKPLPARSPGRGRRLGSLRGCGVPDERLDVDRALASRSVRALEARQPCVDPTPAGAHEVDEQRQIVDARMTLGEKLSLDPLETADGLVEQSSHLGDMAGDREHLCAKPVADCDADLCGNRRFESGRRFRERLDLST